MQLSHAMLICIQWTTPFNKLHVTGIIVVSSSLCGQQVMIIDAELPYSLIIRCICLYLHMTSDCSRHEGCVSITLRTKTAVLLSSKYVLTLAVRNREKSTLAVAESPIPPLLCSNASETLCIRSHEMALAIYLCMAVICKCG